MMQEKAWDREYRNSTFLTKDNKPQADVVRFVSFLKKEQGVDPSGLSVLDLGSGAGRNSFYFAEQGSQVTGLEISGTAVEIAQKFARDAGLGITYHKQSIGDTFPLTDESCDLLLDVTSSNSLSEAERETFLAESHRVLKPSGYFFTKALCKDGDLNAKNLLKQFPGAEKDTYVMPDVGVVERVWSKEDFVSTYSPYFKILHMEKKTSYTRMNNRSYKRNFWIVYMQKV